MNTSNAEVERLAAADAGREPWRLWGPYLSERQWGTVREDYSPLGTAWEYFPHDDARSRVYRWGEDGLAGVSDDRQRLCLALALWNVRDPILKERLFGLANHEGNHGEDVKELYYYLDATPTHSYLKFLYKYPQAEFPYSELVEENRRRGSVRPEFELMDTGVFDDDRYWDVFVEYAKEGPRDVLMRVTAWNRGASAATLHVLPTLWFRNTWAWQPGRPLPDLSADAEGCIRARHSVLGEYGWVTGGEAEMGFTGNETNPRRHFGHTQATGWFKDAFHDWVVAGDATAVNPTQTGTKASFWHRLEVPAQGSACVRVRLSGVPTGADLGTLRLAAAAFDERVEVRRAEADAYFGLIQEGILDPDARNVQRQALAGMIWSKQFYRFEVRPWLVGDPSHPPPPEARKTGRNRDWEHINNADVLSMPDKWEYPWYAAWDLAFHCVPLALVDAAVAKDQLVLLTREWYMHPNGQLPAYEWAFGDVNPPVHGWAAWRVFQIDRKQRRERLGPDDPGDLAFLERVFHKLLLNFTWWVNRKDAQGRNIFQGGFLGLDNIGVFDRSQPLPTGGFINQADGTSWMAMYCLNLMRMALELARHNRVYEDIATKFFEHFLNIAAAINGFDEDSLGLWDEADGFYYDSLCLPDGRQIPMRLRSMVGLVPLFAVEVLDAELLQALPEFNARLEWFLTHRPDLACLVSRWHECGAGDRRLLSLLRGHRMKRLLRRALDESEFLSDHGVRSVSRIYEDSPYRLEVGGCTYEVTYWPGESRNGLFGGNSNWRGPVWMPMNYLLIESLQRFHHYYGDEFTIECPVGSGRYMTLLGAADELTRRLVRLFLPGTDGERPAMSEHRKFGADPNFRNHLWFHEAFHGETGRGIGANHQTGWTGLVAKLLMPRQGEILGVVTHPSSIIFLILILILIPISPPRMPLLLTAVLLLALTIPAAGGQYFPPPDSAGGWRTLKTASTIRGRAGMDLARLEQAYDFTQRCTQNGGLLVVRHGYLVFERYFGRAHRNANPDMASTGKAYTSVASGIMLDVPADYIEQCHRPSPFNPHTPFSLQFEHNADGHVAGAPRDAFYKSGAGGFGLFIVPSLDLVIYKLGGRDSQYDPALTRLAQPFEYDGSRDGWQPIPRTPFHEGSMGGDDGLRRVLEMVSAAVRE